MVGDEGDECFIWSSKELERMGRGSVACTGQNN